MASISDFTINYSPGQTMNSKHKKRFFSAPKSYKINKLINFEPQIKKGVNLNFDSHYVSHKGGFRGHFEFLHLNLFASNVYFWSTKLTQINYIIVNIFSGILIVTVNI